MPELWSAWGCFGLCYYFNYIQTHLVNFLNSYSKDEYEKNIYVYNCLDSEGLLSFLIIVHNSQAYLIR